MFATVPHVAPHIEMWWMIEWVLTEGFSIALPWSWNHTSVCLGSTYIVVTILKNKSYAVPFFGYSHLLHLLHQGAVITPTMDHTMSMQPASMMGPITQQMNHLSLGTTGSVSTMHVINLVILRVITAPSCTVSSHSLSRLTHSLPFSYGKWIKICL